MRALAISVAALALLLAGCGSNNKNAGSSSGGAEATSTPAGTPAAASNGGKTVKLSSPSDGSLKFDETNVAAKAGKVKVEFSNPSQVPHAVEVEGNGVEQKTKTVTGGSASMTVDLKPGKYEFYCPVDGHRAAGMKGTLTVQ
jgi:uncharacterized cupredoxin-like copper-binding protein